MQPLLRTAAHYQNAAIVSILAKGSLVASHGAVGPRSSLAITRLADRDWWRSFVVVGENVLILGSGSPGRSVSCFRIVGLTRCLR
ncbi:hypothetical protein AGR6A_pAt60090 [Agrobacterium sp. NCPPB 925]|nr:hypothetical protein AGR6A_pAt60090 [Agrobacterium sp. NCPPB 925]